MEKSESTKLDRVFKKINNKYIKWLLLFLLGLILLFRWPLANWTRLFITAVVFYVASHWVFGTYLPSFLDIKTWLSMQNEDVIIAIITMGLTVFGFVVAFSSAHSSWRAQRRTDLRLAAGEEISAFFSEALQHMITLEIYAETLISIQEKLKAPERDHDELAFDGRQLVKNTPAFTEARLRLSRMSIQVHGLRSKNEPILGEHFLTMASFSAAQSGFEDVVKLMWFPAPEFAEIPLSALMFVEQTDPAAWKTFNRVSNNKGPVISGGSGAVRGAFIADVIKPNFSAWNALRNNLKKI